MSEKAYEVVHLDELDRFPVDDEGLLWRPVRRRLGITAFGTNAYTAEQGTERVVEEHHEQDGHEELYFVASGRATFVLGDDEIDAPAGTFIYAEPGTKRGAVATEPNTTVLAIGGKPGEAFTPSAWEHYFAADAVAKGGDLDGAYDLLMAGLAEHPGNASILYNAACYRALAGRGNEAIELLSQAFAGDPEAVRNWAGADSDLDSIRDRPDWPLR